METAIDYLLSNLPERYRNAMLNTCQEEIKQAKEKEKEYMVGFYKWMLRTDTADNAEGYFHYTDEDMAAEYFKDFGPGWRDLTQDLEAEPQDVDPAICEYSDLRPVEGYKEEEMSKEFDKPLIVDLDTEEGEKLAEAYKRGYADGYHEGYTKDKEEATKIGDRDFMYKWIREKSGK